MMAQKKLHSIPEIQPIREEKEELSRVNSVLETLLMNSDRRVTNVDSPSVQNVQATLDRLVATLPVPKTVKPAERIEAVKPQKNESRIDQVATVLRSNGDNYSISKTKVAKEALAVCVLFRQGKTVLRSQIHPRTEEALLTALIAVVDQDRLVAMPGWQDRQKETALFTPVRAKHVPILEEPVESYRLETVQTCSSCGKRRVIDPDTGWCYDCGADRCAAVSQFGAWD